MLRRLSISLHAYTIAVRLALVLLAGFFFLIYCPPLKAYVVSMVIQTNPKPNWGPTQPWLVGATNGLDGTASTGNTGYTWSCTNFQDETGSHTCPLVFSNVNASQPTVTGVTSRGTFTIQLCDGAGMNCVTSSASSSPVGAVVFDATTGIVTTGSSTADKFYGPMIAVGQNPWGFEDERSTKMMSLQNTLINTVYPYNSYTDANPSWANDQAGTVSWTWNGKGTNTGGMGTTLHTGISATTLTLDVDDVSVLDLGGLTGSCGSTVTRVTIQANSGSFNQEEVRVCATTGTTGRQTLTVPYDGRGIGSGPLGSAYLIPAQPWLAGAVVGQALTKGSGTSFLTTLAPGGPGFAGPVAYSANTVTVAAGSPTIVGNMTNWVETITGASCLAGTPSDNICPGYIIQIYGTHGGGTPFTFPAFISSVNSTTGMTLTRDYPSDADAGTFSYKIIVPFYRWIVSHYTRGAPYTGGGLTWDALIDWGTTTCEDDTHCFFANVGVQGHGSSAALNGTSWTGKGYTYMDNANSDWPITFGFYGPSLAYRAMWYRAGQVQYLQMANTIDALFPRWPGFADGGAGGYGVVLYTGAGGIAATLDYALNGTPALSDMRPTWNVSPVLYAPEGGTPDCDISDTRSQSYYEGLLFGGAIYDPDISSPDGPGGVPWRTYFRTGVGTANAWDNACKRSNGGVDTNSFANYAAWNMNGQVITLTNGSPMGSGTSIPPDTCTGIEQGTLQVTAGSSSVTANMGFSFSTLTTDIIISGRSYGFNRLSSTTGKIAVLWPGSTDMAASYTTENNTGHVSGYMAAFGVDQHDTSLKNNYGCLWINSSQITLDRNFSGNVSPTAYYMFNANGSEALAGYGQQPFYVAIKTYMLNLVAPLDSTLSLNNASLRNGVGDWVFNNGYDNQAGQNGTQAIYWARICSFCESGGPNDGAFDYTTSVSRIGNNGNGPNQTIQEERELNVEGFNGLMWSYINNATPTNRAIIDYLYGALWGNDSYDSMSIHTYTDSWSVGNTPGFLNLSDASIGDGKWAGYFFGMGMAHEWAALRQCVPVGGVIPVVNGVIQCLASSTTGGTAAGGNVAIGGNATRN